jgi:hypothetical protein
MSGLAAGAIVVPLNNQSARYSQPPRSRTFLERD